MTPRNYEMYGRQDASIACHVGTVLLGRDNMCSNVIQSLGRAAALIPLILMPSHSPNPLPQLHALHGQPGRPHLLDEACIAVHVDQAVGLVEWQPVPVLALEHIIGTPDVVTASSTGHKRRHPLSNSLQRRHFVACMAAHSEKHRHCNY